MVRFGWIYASNHGLSQPSSELCSLLNRVPNHRVEFSALLPNIMTITPASQNSIATPPSTQPIPKMLSL
jgi:hypothetical protein